ncbi:MAG TPA: galactokinase [Thermoanaerobaculia bacterium]|nr:galactokinase [Thermoanaerobaculia bacterium]
MPRRTVPSFQDLYGRPSEIAASAPGRVNLIGEHTDYNGGYVLPLAIPQRTRAELARRTDRTVAAWSAEATPPHPAATEPESYVLGEEERRGDWRDYLQGVTKILFEEGFALGGCNLRITSEVPVGSGLSSSAALTVTLLRALVQAFSLALDDVRLARLAQRVETDFVGAPVGVMDPMAASLADTAHALFLDTRSLAFERVPLPRGAGLVVVDSAIPHRHAAGAAGEYRTRRQECEEAAQLLGVAQLRDLTAADLPRVARLPSPLDRRARHVLTEDERVLAAVAALRAGDLPALGQLLDASHASLRDDYEVSVEDVDRLVELARDETAVYGARLTGGGFGGSIVALARADAAREAGERIAGRYREWTGREGRLLVPE